MHAWWHRCCPIDSQLGRNAMTPHGNRRTPLTERMAEDMLVRNLSPRTIDSYTYHVDRFVGHFARPAEALGPEEIRQYQLHLIKDRKVGWSSFNQSSAKRKRFAGERAEVPGTLHDRRPDLGSAADRARPGESDFPGPQHQEVQTRRRGPACSGHAVGRRVHASLVPPHPPERIHQGASLRRLQQPASQDVSGSLP